jgi:hypothetical protein
MKKGITCVGVCLLVLVLLGAGDAVLAGGGAEHMARKLSGEGMCISGPVMEVDCDRGFIVVNEKTLYVGPYSELDISLESLKKNHRVAVKIQPGQDKLWIKKLTRITK